MEEMSRLAETAGAVPVVTIMQRRSRPDPARFIGKGKVEEVVRATETHAANVVLVDAELSATQQRTLEREIGVKVVDRTALVLDIFARRAQTARAGCRSNWRRCNTCCPRLDWPRGLALATRRRHRHPGPRRNQARGRSAPYPYAHYQPATRDRDDPSASQSPARAPRGGGGATGGARRLHQRREIYAAQCADRRRCVCRGPSLCDARSDGAASGAAEPACGRACRHRRVHPAPADSAGGGLSRDARRSGLCRPAAPRDRCEPSGVAEQAKVVGKVLHNIGAGTHPVITVFNKVDRLGVEESRALAGAIGTPCWCRLWPGGGFRTCCARSGAGYTRPVDSVCACACRIVKPGCWRGCVPMGGCSAKITRLSGVLLEAEGPGAACG